MGEKTYTRQSNACIVCRIEYATYIEVKREIAYLLEAFPVSLTCFKTWPVNELIKKIEDV